MQSCYSLLAIGPPTGTFLVWARWAGSQLGRPRHRGGHVGWGRMTNSAYWAWIHPLLTLIRNSLCTTGGAELHAPSVVISFHIGLRKKKNFRSSHSIPCVNQSSRGGVHNFVPLTVYIEFLYLNILGAHQQIFSSWLHSPASCRMWWHKEGIMICPGT